MRSPHQYVIQQGVERAKQVLKQGRRAFVKWRSPVASSQSHFNRHFRRLTGVTTKNGKKARVL